MRGEDTVICPFCGRSHGSPPHARGRLVEGLLHLHGRGITPACAGKTSRKICTAPHAQDHPRMRGKDLPATGRRLRGLGSPPHARGRLQKRFSYEFRNGITPACAGKTSGPPTRSLRRRDHPRMRGEDGAMSCLGRTSRGSPPHARGRRRGERNRESPNGITPACAGKTAQAHP